MIGYTIVGGFLGSGKTSLINSLLSTTTERTTVIVNDLGDVNIDAALIASVSDDTIELTNGCVCCSIGDSLATTLRDLSMVSSPPDRIVLECSGAADPGLVARYGSRRVLAEPVVVVTADATDVRRRSEDPRFASLVTAQLKRADLLVVTKSDLVEDASETATWLQSMVTATVVIGHPDEIGSVLPQQRMTIESSQPPMLTTGRHVFNERVVATDIASWLRSIPGLVRAKGVVATASGPLLIQWAADQFEMTPWNGHTMPNEIITIAAETAF